MADDKNSQGILIILIIAIIAFAIWWYYKHRKEQEDVSGRIEIVQEKSDASFYPTFVSGKDNKIRYNSPSFSYNPATNTLSSANFKGNLQGSATNIDVLNIPDDVVIQPKVEGYHQTGYYGIEKFSFQKPKENQARFRGDVVQPDSVSDLATPSDLVSPSGVVKPGGQYFLPLVGSAAANQQLRARNALKYDVSSNTITATTNYANNISGGAAGQVPYQAGPGNTQFTVPGPNNSVLLYDGTKPIWRDSASVSFGSAATAANIAKPAGSVLFQSAANTTSVLPATTAGDAYLSFANGAPQWRTFSANPANAGTVNVVALA